MKKWIYLILKCLVFVITFCALYFFPSKEMVDDLAKATIGFAVIVFLEWWENNMKDMVKPLKKKKDVIWHVEQNGEDLFLTTDCPREGKIYEGDMFRCSGFIDGYQKRLNTEMRVCFTYKNPYCSRTLKERQKKNVVVHTQYGWECSDYEKWLGSSGGFEFIKKEKK